MPLKLTFELQLHIKDSSLPSLIGGLEELIPKIKADLDRVEAGQKLEYSSSYEEENHSGSYSASIKSTTI